jgi:hypothetical protein
MLTLISVPKAFVGLNRVVQDNAIGSWTRLGAACEIVLFGNDPGVAEAAARHQVKHQPQITRTAEGTPVLSDVFAHAHAIARHPLLCFVNADIVLLNDFLRAVHLVTNRFREFLLISSRFNLRIDEPLPFGAQWDEALRGRARAEGNMYPAGGSDVFVYSRGLFPSVPPFAIGRGYWDNWLMFEAVRRGARLIDATEMLTAVHQEHGYGHVTGLPENSGIASVLNSTEAAHNLRLAGGKGRLFTAYDATEILTDDGRLVPTLHPRLVRRRFKASIRRAFPMSGAIRALTKIAK